jgi:uncharacterized protein YjbI with pentapeptide repeats
VIAPILLLLLMQIQFLPFHDIYITWIHRIALLADLTLVWWLWRKILAGRDADGRSRRSSWAWPAVNLALSLGAVLFSWTVATFPGEWQEDFLAKWDKPRFAVSLHDWVFNSAVDPVTRRRWLPFSSTLVLSGLNIYEGLNIDDPKKGEWRDFVFRARGRDLKGAILDLASLPKVDFEGAQLQGASFYRAQLQGASLYDAQLQGAQLQLAQLQGASLRLAHLQDASLYGAQLQGASLVYAMLRGTELGLAQLQGALLDKADLQGALLDKADLQGASLVDVELQGASLGGAQLQGVLLDRAHLYGASLDGAQLQGASLHGVQLQGASLQQARLRATDLSGALLWRTNHAAASTGEIAEVAVVRLSDSSDQWLPVWRPYEVQPWDEKVYQTLRHEMEYLPPGLLLDQALERIQRLDCDSSDTTLASCDPSLPVPAEAAGWRRSLEGASVDDAVYAKALAVELKTLVCSGGENAGYVLHGLLRDPARFVSTRLAATSQEAPALIDFIMGKVCPVSPSLTDDDVAKLLRIKQETTKRPGG